MHPTNGNGNGGNGHPDDDEDDVPTRVILDDGYAPGAAKLIIDTLGSKMHFVGESVKQIEVAVEYLQAGQVAQQASIAELDKKLDKILKFLESK